MLHILPRQNYQRGTKSSNTGACGGHSTSKPQWTLGSRGQQQAGGENKLTGGFPAEGGRHGQDPELPEEDGGREAGSYSWALRETDRHVSMLEKQLFLRERNRERAKNGGGGKDTRVRITSKHRSSESQRDREATQSSTAHVQSERH